MREERRGVEGVREDRGGEGREERAEGVLEHRTMY